MNQSSRRVIQVPVVTQRIQLATKMPAKRKKQIKPLPIVFVGPSIPQNEARKILNADYRPPIRRGDLETIPANSIVAIIDGVFDQALSVSPTEIRAALNRQIRILGASSMGALRAVEVPGVEGVGRIYQMYVSGAIEGDDEVALIFDPENMRSLCEPLVNVRHAVDRLARPGTISRQIGSAIVNATRKLPYPDRSYPLILKEAGINDRKERDQLIAMLGSHDLKREDAITLLEKLRDVKSQVSPRSGLAEDSHGQTVPDTPVEERVSVHCWEFGEPYPFVKVVEFMAITGSLSKYAVRVQNSINGDDRSLSKLSDESTPQELFDRLLAQTARAWHWATEEEVETSLEDLGLRQDLVERGMTAQVLQELNAMVLLRTRPEEFFEALRVILFLDDLALKRETARASSLHWLASRGARTSKRALTAAELDASRKKLCRLLDVRNPEVAMRILGGWGIGTDTFEQFAEQLAYVRREPSVNLQTSRSVRRDSCVKSSPKASNNKRFCKSLADSYETAKKIVPIIGITRVGVITKLGRIGIPNAQAFRPDGEWSSTVGSGKSETLLGAKVGAIMEEAEKWAQEKFSAGAQSTIAEFCSFAKLRQHKTSVIDPSTLDLPYDSCYSEKLEIEWHSVIDLISGSRCLLPTAAVTHRRVVNDIYYSTRGGRKVITTNGLASGMTLAEALTHALCEYVERHAMILDSVTDGNPGSPTASPRLAINLATVPRSTRRLLRKIEAGAGHLVVREITSRIQVPTFHATIFLAEGPIEGQLFLDQWQRANGWAAHPDPETSLNMAILEASQTILTHVAGAREDLLLHSRSLGRHERTNSRRWKSFAGEMDDEARLLDFSSIRGLSSDNAAEDVTWILKQIANAGYHQALVADYSSPLIKPIRVVRVIIPGLETINPFHTGVSARRAILSDLLPNGS